MIPKDLRETMHLIESSDYFWLGLTLSAYLLGLVLNRRLKNPLINPLLVGIIFLTAILYRLGADTSRYDEAVRPLVLLMTPATICLAVPLYRQLPLLRKHAGAVLAGILLGVIANALCLLVLGWFFGLSRVQFATLLPKSITTAIGIGLSKELGGISDITVAAIVVSGILGNVMASKICSLLGIEDPLAVGLSIGTASHALGTVRALEIGEVEGAMSGLAIVVTGLLTVLVAPLFMSLIC
ncbi:LrgB family protein [uncultured Fretibacterium sp.]|uniref:LrgB family protein n=1 Tax=uncultured Fretibacterium sp. TaxID=1678694 RepID=UPI00325F9720